MFVTITERIPACVALTPVVGARVFWHSKITGRLPLALRLVNYLFTYHMIFLRKKEIKFWISTPFKNHCSRNTLIRDDRKWDLFQGELVQPLSSTPPSNLATLVTSLHIIITILTMSKPECGRLYGVTISLLYADGSCDQPQAITLNSNFQ